MLWHTELGCKPILIVESPTVKKYLNYNSINSKQKEKSFDSSQSLLPTRNWPDFYSHIYFCLPFLWVGRWVCLCNQSLHTENKEKACTTTTSGQFHIHPFFLPKNKGYSRNKNLMWKCWRFFREGKDTKRNCFINSTMQTECCLHTPHYKEYAINT